MNTTYYAHWKFNMDFTMNNVTIAESFGEVNYLALFNYIPPGNFGFTVSNLTGTSGGSALRPITSPYGPAISVEVNGHADKVIDIDCDISFTQQNQKYNLWTLIKAPHGCEGMALVSGNSTFELINKSY